jgi:proline-specific peptidase
LHKTGETGVAVYREGFVSVEDGYRVWYCVHGPDETTSADPLLVLHAGPGTGHDGVASLADLGAERAVVLYDQLGCGRSDSPDDPSRWVMDRFVREIDLLREALNLERLHLFGSSWGGFLAIEYLLGRSEGVVSAVLASTTASTLQFEESVTSRVQEMPDEFRRILEAEEPPTDSAYEEAVMAFYLRHLCRMDPWPDEMQRAGASIFGPGRQTYETMWGPNETVVTGNLRAWDRSQQLGEIDVPVLVTYGRYDEVTPEFAEFLQAGIPDAAIEVFEDSSHTAHFEERARYMQVVGDFLRDAETRKH